MTKDRLTIIFLAALTAVAIYFCYLLVAPFLKPITFSVILAIVFYPVYARIERWSRNRTFAALFSTAFVILLIAGISIFLGHAVISGLGDLYQSLKNPGNARERLGLYVVTLFERAAGWISQYYSTSVPGLQEAISSQAQKIVSNLLAMSVSAVGGITSQFVNALISFFILFFMFRDGRAMLRRVAVVVPLRRDQVIRLYTCVKVTLNAILYGTVAIAVIQGALTAIAFAILGISSPALWGVVTSLCALLPVIGTAIVTAPAIVMLIVNGHWVKGVILLVWALIIVHPVDNIVRPYLIGGRTKQPTLYVFFALLGGLKAFGSLGIFIGPLILALTMALFRFLREEKRTFAKDLALTSMSSR